MSSQYTMTPSLHCANGFFIHIWAQLHLVKPQPQVDAKRPKKFPTK